MKRFFQNIGGEVHKNFKLIFRNWSTLLLIVLAPLILIMIVGYSLGGDNIHDVNLGVISDSNINIYELSDSLKGVSQIREYSTKEECIASMGLEKVHVCIYIKGDFESKNAEVTFYYDNTRPKITSLIITELQSYFGSTAEKISLVSVQEIIKNLQDLYVFFSEGTTSIEEMQNESLTIEQDLIERKEQLIEIQKEFQPKYLFIKSTYPKLNATQSDVNQSVDEIQAMLNVMDDLSNDLLVKMNQSPVQNILLNSVYNEIEDNKQQLEAIRKSNNSDPTLWYASMDKIIYDLDIINQFLDEEIKRSDNYITVIRASREKMQGFVDEANEKMSTFADIDPSMANKLVKPITQSFEAMLNLLEPMQTAFPMLLPIIVIFISLLLSTVITSLEINNKAYMRNILAPVNDIIFTIGLAITNFIIIFAQVIVLLIVAETQFKIMIFANLFNILIISALLVLLFVLLGMLIAYMTKDIQTSILLSTFLALAFFLLSDALNALEAMPILAYYLALANPLVIVEGVLRQMFFFARPLSDLSGSLLIILLYIAILMVILFIIAKKKNKKRL